MAGNQNSGRKRNTAPVQSASGRKKTATGSGTGKKTMSSKKSAVKKSSSPKKTSGRKKQEQIYSEPVMDDIKLIAVLAVCILMLLSVFGLGGRAGDKAAYFLFGMFGLLAYAIPFILFIGIAFHISNRKNSVAHIKIAAAVVFLAMILGIITLSDPLFDGTGELPDGFLDSAASRDGGGLIGYFLGWLLISAFGRIGSTVILVCMMLISGVLVTGRRIFVRLGKLIAAACSNLGRRLSAWWEARAEARLRRAEALEYEEDMDEEDFDEEDDSGTVEVIYRNLTGKQGRNKAANIVMTEKKESADDIVKDIVNEDVNEESPFTKEHLDSFDHGQTVNPLHIQVPEFMKGGRIHVSNLNADTAPEKPDGSTDQAEALSDAAAEENRFAQRVLTVDDLNLKIEGLDDDEPEERTCSGESTETDALMEAEAVSAEVKPDTARNKAPAADKNAAVKRKVSENDADGEEKTVEINEEEIEKYEFPPLELLEKGIGSKKSVSSALMKQTALKLQQTFDSFGVGVQVTNATPGPGITRYEIQPDLGVKVSRILNLSDDIKLNLAVPSIRIEAPIPGKAAVGIEVPNKEREMVYLRDLLESDKVRNTKSKLAFVVGKDIGGQPVVADIEKMPHLLIAGATGSGKSVCINTIIMSILYRADPNEVKMIMIDPKVVELNVYNGLPHLLIPVVTDPKKAAGALNWAVSTMMERYNKFAEIGAKDLKSYNARVENVPYDSERHRKMSQIVIIIDELADLMMVAQSEVEDAICRLAQLARAAGIHLVIATQRPSVNVITGLIKANVPSRIAFSVSSGVDSRTILDTNGAEKLLGNGDMLFYPQGYPQPDRVQGAFVSENEIGRVTDFIRANMSNKPVYSEEIKRSIETSVSSSGAASSGSERDIYFEEAGRFVIEKEKASIGMLQRVYKIGFNRAARIMDQLCDAGVVGPEIGTKPRQIIMTMEEFEEFLKENQ